jgi:tetratricopeptide (TPR) repeat protein
VNDNPGSHPAEETLAALAEGRLARAEIQQLLPHLATCRRCTLALETASEVRTPAHRQGSWRIPAIAAAAAAVVLALALPLFWHKPSATERLIALAPAASRNVEPRLSGFPWAPYRATNRAGGGTADAAQLRLGGAAGEILQQANTQRTAAAQHDAGIALLLVEQPEEAVARLREAAAHPPIDARTWSDLSVAEYAAAIRLGRTTLFPEALAAADRALAADPHLPEALFNRALVLERLGLSPQAREAWQRFLAADRTSKWADEARRHLASLPPLTGEMLFKRDESRLEQAAAAGDRYTVNAIVALYPQQSRTFMEAETLGRWADAVKRNDAGAAARELSTARAVGEALVQRSYESLLHDAVAAIDGADAPRRAALAEAHAAYRRGRIAYSTRHLSEAAAGLHEAASAFARNDSPMSLAARYFAASVQFDSAEIDGACGALEGLRDEADRHDGYRALGAQIRWELVLCRMSDNDWSGALPLASSAAETFARLGERSNEATMQGMLADALTSLGRPDDAWSARIHAFTAQSAEGRADRLPLSIGSAARMELRSGRPESARALLHLEEQADRASGDLALLCNALVREAALEAGQGDDAAGATKASEALAIARRIGAPEVRARLMADAQFADGAASWRTRPIRAIEALTGPIDYYRTHEKLLFLPECYLLRGRAALRLGRPVEALRDFDEGIGAMEAHPAQFAGGVTGTSVLDAGSALFREAIRLRLDGGDTNGAFACMERSRARLSPRNATAPITIAELQSRLQGSGAAVLELVDLEGELAGICVSERSVTAARSPIHQDALAALAAGGDDGQSYNLLIRPFAATLAGARELIVVAGPPLENVPFAALYERDKHRRLIEMMAVAGAVSAASLQIAPPFTRPATVAAVALSNGSLPALPEAQQELHDVEALYARSVELAGDHTSFAGVVKAAAAADVVHLAGHTEPQPGSGAAAFLLGGQRISWRTAATTPIGTRPVLVLAACETLRAPQARESFALSLGAGFLAAGVRDVIGTLAPVADNEAREIFRSIHRQLAAGVDPTLAVQRAQVEAIAGQAGHVTTAWRAVALITNRIPPRHI